MDLYLNFFWGSPDPRLRPNTERTYQMSFLRGHASVIVKALWLNILVACASGGRIGRISKMVKPPVGSLALTQAI